MVQGVCHFLVRAPGTRVYLFPLWAFIRLCTDDLCTFICQA